MKSTSSHNKTCVMPSGEPTQRIYDLDRTQRIRWIPPTHLRLTVTPGGEPIPDRQVRRTFFGALAAVIGCLLLLFFWPKGDLNKRAIAPPVQRNLPQVPASAPAHPPLFSLPSSVVSRVSPSYVAPPSSSISDRPEAQPHYLTPPAAPRPQEGNSF